MQQQAYNTASLQTPQNPAPRQWYIQVAGQNYGPFNDQTLWQFMCEGRVTAQSLISQNLGQPFQTLSRDPALMGWLGQIPTQQQNPAPQTAHGAPLTHPIAAVNATDVSQTAKASVFVVMADIKSGQDMSFLKGLQALGSAKRIGDNLWLLRAASDVDQIRNHLSQSLNHQDRLFLLDSFANRTSGFNLGPDMDQRIREMWNVER